MDILKDQVQKLKQIAQQLRDEKVNYKGQIKSLESVNSQYKAQIAELTAQQQSSVVALQT